MFFFFPFCWLRLSFGGFSFPFLGIGAVLPIPVVLVFDSFCCFLHKLNWDASLSSSKIWQENFPFGVCFPLFVCPSLLVIGAKYICLNSSTALLWSRLSPGFNHVCLGLTQCRAIDSLEIPCIILLTSKGNLNRYTKLHLCCNINSLLLVYSSPWKWAWYDVKIRYKS